MSGRRGEADSPVAIIIRLAGFRHRSPGKLRRTQLLAFPFQFRKLFRARLFETAGADEFHNAPQFILIEPRAMRPAHIHHHARTMSKGTRFISVWQTGHGT